jgi:hypothetical protein
LHVAGSLIACMPHPAGAWPERMRMRHSSSGRSPMWKSHSNRRETRTRPKCFAVHQVRSHRASGWLGQHTRHEPRHACPLDRLIVSPSHPRFSPSTVRTTFRGTRVLRRNSWKGAVGDMRAAYTRLMGCQGTDSIRSNHDTRVTSIRSGR